MRKFLIASDSFKDALSAGEVCEAIARGIRRAIPEADIIELPMGDGGEGTAGIITQHVGGHMVDVEAKDPLFRTIRTQYGLSPDGNTAYIDMAAASGLQLLTAPERNPLHTTTYGTGELILDAVHRGARHIVLCIGGSATHDCGAGMAEALGYAFLDAGGQPVRPIGGNLIKMAYIDAAGLKINVQSLRVEVLCDVVNPLYGPTGAAYMFSRQKGADEKAVELLEEGTQHFSILLQEHLDKKTAGMPGAGAAGGLGAGAWAFLNASMVSGTEYVSEVAGLQRAMAEADLVFTGEGRLDEQTIHGKLISGIVHAASEYQIPVIALCGSLSLLPEQIESMGITAAFAINNRPCSLAEALAETAANLERTAFSVVRTLAAGERFTPVVIANGGEMNRHTADMLSKRETEVLQLIAQGYTNPQIATTLFISSQTVAVHRKNIMRKLGVNKVTALLKKGFDSGIFF